MKKDQAYADDRIDLSEREKNTVDDTITRLLSEARNGSLEALQALRHRYKPLLDTSVARYTTVEMSLQEKEDMREEAERIFLSAVSTYDTEQDAVDFGLYAKICLRNGLVSEMRSLSARHRLGIVPLEAEELPGGDDPGHALLEAEKFRRLYHMIREHLSEMENTVWWMYVSGVSVRNIAEKIGKDERSVHNAIYRIRKKLRILLENEPNDN